MEWLQAQTLITTLTKLTSCTPSPQLVFVQGRENIPPFFPLSKQRGSIV